MNVSSTPYRFCRSVWIYRLSRLASSCRRQRSSFIADVGHRKVLTRFSSDAAKRMPLLKICRCVSARMKNSCRLSGRWALCRCCDYYRKFGFYLTASSHLQLLNAGNKPARGCSSINYPLRLRSDFLSAGGDTVMAELTVVICK